MLSATRTLVLLALLLAGCAVKREEPARRPSPPSAAEALPAEDAWAGGEEGEPAGEDALYQGDLKPFIIGAAASSTGGTEYCAERAFDGAISTRWTSVFADGEWVEAYFDRPVEIEHIKIEWETARAADFSIQLRNKKMKWVTVGSRAGASGPMDSLTFAEPLPTTGLRIQCERRATEWGNSIFEVYAFGSTTGSPPATNLIGFVVMPTPWQAREREIAARLLEEAAGDPPASANLADDVLLELIARRSFDYFWWETHPTNGLTRDRGRNFGSSEDANIASVAAVGYALTAYAIGAERGWVDRAEARERVLLTLRTFADGPVRNVKGFFPHFVNLFTGEDAKGTEISTIDTALFLAGMIVAMEHFQDPEVTALSKRILERVEWDWARNGHAHFVSHGLDAGGRFLDARWGTTTEGLLIYLLALGSPTHPLPAAAWDAIDRHTGTYEGYTFICEYGFQSIFRYQYPALWYDFRGRRDRSGTDYFENATVAVMAMREYCLRHADRFVGSYGPNLWGQGAADGPGDQYMIYGFPPGDPYSPIDGTVVPYAVAGSISFLPRHAMAALRTMYDEHHEAWGKYGFADSFNPNQAFVARDAIGLDAGTILLAIENYRSGFVWKLFMRNEWIRETTRQIGWTTRPRPEDVDGPVDLARGPRWRLQAGGGVPTSPALDDSAWPVVLVPDRWENASPDLYKHDGVAWYRVEFNLSSERLAGWTASGRPYALVMGGVDDADATYLNGLKIGETGNSPESYRTVRRYRIPPAVLRAGRNVLAVEVTDRGGYGGIWMTPVEIGPEW